MYPFTFTFPHNNYHDHVSIITPTSSRLQLRTPLNPLDETLHGGSFSVRDYINSLINDENTIFFRVERAPLQAKNII